MSYLKFAGLSLVAGIVFLICEVISERSFFRDFAGGYLSVALALAVTGVGFTRVKPAHFKFGYAIWIAVSFISYYGTRWALVMQLRAGSGTSRGTLFVLMEFMGGWFLGCVLLNPVCYVLGKRLAYRLLRDKKISSMAEQFD